MCVQQVFPKIVRGNGACDETLLFREPDSGPSFSLRYIVPNVQKTFHGPRLQTVKQRTSRARSKLIFYPLFLFLCTSFYIFLPTDV